MQQYVQQLIQIVQGLDQEKLARWAAMGLVIGVSYTASVTTWKLVSVFQSPEAVTLPPMAAPRHIPNQSARSSSLSNLHLFGNTEQAPASGAIDAPETRLNLSLNGVIASSDKRVARAFISAGSGTEKSYRLEASLPGGAILKEIHADRVILLRSGRYETLRMPKKLNSIVIEEDHPAPASNAPANRIQPKVSREEVLQYKQKLLTAPKELAGAIRQRPVRRNGKIIGYRLFPGSDKDAFKRLGLRPGDIITGVNGMPLSDPASAMALYGQLPQMSELNIELQRGGQNMSLTLPWK
jgi:general secretion pathway protein C